MDYNLNDAAQRAAFLESTGMSESALDEVRRHCREQNGADLDTASVGETAITPIFRGNVIQTSPSPLDTFLVDDKPQRKIKVRCTFEIDVEFDADRTDEELISYVEDNHCPATGSIGAEFDEWYQRMEEKGFCWGCALQGKNEIIEGLRRPKDDRFQQE